MVFPRLCLPHSPKALRHTNIIRLELVQSNGRGESEDAQEPAAKRTGFRHTLLGEVVDDGCPGLSVSHISSPPFLGVIFNVLESNVRVEDQERAESGIRDGVKAAGSERSDTQGNQANCDESI